MKLLIVDDEKLTREGIRDSLGLESLGISQVLLEDDGIHGLKTALEERPDIVLTDVRMPRMNGVQMAERILKELPGTSIIFMSAYSDKEYLKAAIKLKALGYVEKPLDMEELASAVKEAVDSSRNEKISQAAARLQEKEQLGHLSLLLSQPEEESLIKAGQLAADLGLSITHTTCFCCIIIDCVTPLSALPEEQMDGIRDYFMEYLTSMDISQAYVLRGDHRIIVFLHSPVRPADKTLYDCAGLLAQKLIKICPFFISLGPVVSGMDRAHLSYQEASEHLKEAFFHDYGFILTRNMETAVFRPPADLLLEFSMALSEKQEEEALDIVRRLYESFVPNDMIGPSQVKDIYYKYFSKLDEHGLGSYISLWQKEGLESESIWEGVMNCTILRELNDLLAAKVRLFFERLRGNSVGNPVVFQIKEYIHKNYAVPSLSVPDVSEYVRLSSSYVCTIFKNETGQTLNQYLTDYRIKMSKQFLSDPRYKIADISSKVGYSDGNYYSKTMQHPKMTDLSQTRTSIIMDYGNVLRVNLHINHNHDYAPDYQESMMKIEGMKGAIRIQLGLILDYPTGRPDKVEYITDDGKGWRELEVKGSWFNEAFIGTMGGLMKKLEDPSYHYMNSVEDAYHTMCVVEACYKSNAEGGTPVEYGR